MRNAEYHNPSPRRRRARGVGGRGVIRGCAGALLLLLPLLGSGQESVNLPSMGDPADQILSPAQERELGEAFMQQVAEQRRIIEDPLLNEYIQALGEALASASEHAGTAFTFFLVNDGAINAFAAPGGYIGVNSGLLLAAGNEAQLAGVLAHEVAHVTQRHIARAYAAAQTSSLPTAAAILAAILLGGQNRQATQAALATGIATTQQLQLNYTRANEYEADRLGIQFLSRARYDPTGMVEFFSVLERNNASSGLNRPEYLSTHPLSSNRIAEARGRAQSLSEAGQRLDSSDFRLARARLQVLTSENHARLYSTVRQQLPGAHGTARESLTYSAALLAHETGDFAAAEAYLEQLLAAAPDHLHFGILSARNAYARQQPAAGRAIFRELLDVYPGNVPVLLELADLSEKQGELAAAAASLRETLSAGGYQLAGIYRALARVEDKRGNTVESLESLAEYHNLRGNTGLAIKQLEQALRKTRTGSAQSLRVEARLSQLRDAFAERLRQRGG